MFLSKPFPSSEIRLVLRDHILIFNSFEIYCSTCYRRAGNLPKEETMIACPSCVLVHHCTLCKPATHPCSVLQEARLDEEFSIRHCVSTGQVAHQMVTMELKTAYTPISTAKTWDDYYGLISDKGDALAIETKDRHPEQDRSFRAATGMTTIVLTILAALELVHPDLATKTDIFLHLIGAGEREVDSLMLFDELLHLLPALKNLHLCLIGLELPTTVSHAIIEGCPMCITAGNVKSWESRQSTYHEYVKTSDYQTPDLAVVFHTGYTQEFATEWIPTISHLVSAKHATVFTSFNLADMTQATANLEKSGAWFLQKGEENRWRGQRPYLEVSQEKEFDVFYMNWFWFVIGPKPVGEIVDSSCVEILRKLDV